MGPEDTQPHTHNPPKGTVLAALVRLARAAIPGSSCELVSSGAGDSSNPWCRPVPGAARDPELALVVRPGVRGGPTCEEGQVLDDLATLAAVVLALPEEQQTRCVLRSSARGGDAHPEQDFDPRRMLVRVEKMLGARAARKGLVLQTEMDDTVPTRLHGRSGTMGQLLVALGGHVIAKEGRGPVSIRVSMAGAGSEGDILLHAEIRGSGPASVPGDWESLWPGGTLELENEPAGGSVIRVDVPFRRVRIDVPDSAPARPRVLLVDDSPVNLKIARSLLAKLGCDTFAASNGEEAVAAFEGGAFDLILMDCQMPVMDGFTATREIRKREAAGTRVPIVALTGSTLAAEQRACLDAGMDDVLEKPFRGGDLRSLLERHTRRRAA